MTPEPDLTTLPPFLDTTALLTGAAIAALLLLSAFFSGSETALTAASRAKLTAQADKGDRGAARVLGVTEDGERMIGALLLGNNIVKILAASLATALLTRLFGDGGVALAAMVMTGLVLIFGEVLPKTLAISNPEGLAIRVAPAVRVLISVLSPVVSVVRLLVSAILRLAGVRPDDSGRMLAIREEIADAIALGHSEGAVEKEDRDRLLGALDLRERTIEEIMLHRRDIEMISADLPSSEILSRVLASPHTRLPLWRGERENIVGVIHAKDLLREVERALRQAGDAPEERAGAMEALDVLKVAMKPYFVPETTTLDEQMREFLKRRTHFALVIDEYGALQGLITLEDIIEEIVGDISDEFDVQKKHIALQPDAEGDYLIDGSMTIRDLNRATDWDLPDTEAITVAGLMIHEAQMIPAAGQAFRFHGVRFEVAERLENRLTRLRIRKL